jgi:hypothetical protein
MKICGRRNLLLRNASIPLLQYSAFAVFRFCSIPLLQYSAFVGAGDQHAAFAVSLDFVFTSKSSNKFANSGLFVELRAVCRTQGCLSNSRATFV